MACDQLRASRSRREVHASPAGTRNKKESFIQCRIHLLLQSYRHQGNTVRTAGLITLPTSLLPTWVVTKPCGQGTPPKGNLARWPLVSSPSTYCVTLGEEPVFSEPQFLHLFNGGNNPVPRGVVLMRGCSQLRPQEGTPGYQGPPGLPECL